MSAIPQPRTAPAEGPKDPTTDESPARRRFCFERDSLAFENQLVWHYVFDESTGDRRVSRRDPPPTFAHRCFPLARMVHLFFHHAEFRRDERNPEVDECRRLIRRVLARNPRAGCSAERRIEIGGWRGLREFSRDHESLLKDACGGAWRSYVLRSHWRMVFQISRRHQADTAARLRRKLDAGKTPIIHLVRFPELSINHGMVVYDVSTIHGGLKFLAYDPNDTRGPAVLSYLSEPRTFSLTPNHYWPGGPLNLIEIFRHALF